MRRVPCQKLNDLKPLRVSLYPFHKALISASGQCPETLRLASYPESLLISSIIWPYHAPVKFSHGCPSPALGHAYDVRHRHRDYTDL